MGYCFSNSRVCTSSITGNSISCNSEKKMFNQSDELTGIPKEAAFNETEIYVSSKP